jgi:hypothetical protein
VQTTAYVKTPVCFNLAFLRRSQPCLPSTQPTLPSFDVVNLVIRIDFFAFSETVPHASGGLQFVRSLIARRRIDQRLPNRRASVANHALDRR